MNDNGQNFSQDLINQADNKVVLDTIIYDMILAYSNGHEFENHSTLKEVIGRFKRVFETGNIDYITRKYSCRQRMIYLVNKIGLDGVRNIIPMSVENYIQNLYDERYYNNGKNHTREQDEIELCLISTISTLSKYFSSEYVIKEFKDWPKHGNVSDYKLDIDKMNFLRSKSDEVSQIFDEYGGFLHFYKIMGFSSPRKKSDINLAHDINKQFKFDDIAYDINKNLKRSKENRIWLEDLLTDFMTTHDMSYIPESSRDKMKNIIDIVGFEGLEAFFKERGGIDKYAAYIREATVQIPFPIFTSSDLEKESRKIIQASIENKKVNSLNEQINIQDLRENYFELLTDFLNINQDPNNAEELSDYKNIKKNIPSSSDLLSGKVSDQGLLLMYKYVKKYGNKLILDKHKGTIKR